MRNKLYCGKEQKFQNWNGWNRRNAHGAKEEVTCWIQTPKRLEVKRPPTAAFPSLTPPPPSHYQGTQHWVPRTSRWRVTPEEEGNIYDIQQNIWGIEHIDARFLSTLEWQWFLSKNHCVQWFCNGFWSSNLWTRWFFNGFQLYWPLVQRWNGSNPSLWSNGEPDHIYGQRHQKIKRK